MKAQKPNTAMRLDFKDYFSWEPIWYVSLECYKNLGDAVWGARL